MSTSTLTNMLHHVDTSLLRSVVTPNTFNIISSEQEDQAAVLSILTTAATTATLETPITAEATISTTAIATTSPNEYEEESDDEEEKDLTNLTWLTELRNQSIAWPNAINPALDDEKDNTGNTAELGDYVEEVLDCADMSATCPDGQDKSHNASVGRSKCSKSKTGKHAGAAAQQQAQLVKRPTPMERYEMFLDKVKHDLAEYAQSADNYQLDTSEKPPFNYSHIIGMAMLENGRVTLQQICSWIEAKFAFFRVRKKWNNSIRHNLSLHHCFRKIDRNKYEKGKGGYWELGMDPKKCDRKRIRNRKSGQNKNKQLQGNHKTAASTTTNPTASTSFNFDSNNAPATPMESDDISNIASGLETNEELLLDELDVQQNIDVSSCSHQQQQQQQLLQQQQQQQQQVEDIFIANILTQATQDDEADATATMISAADLAELAALAGHSSNNNNNCNSSNMLQHQQYQLGTIIISASAADVAAATTTFNCLISDNYNNNSEQQHNILYTEDDIPSACENVIISSYLANSASASATGNLDEFSIDANPNTNKQILHQHHATTSTSNATIPYSQRPNVIVESLEQPTGHYAAAAAASHALSSSHHPALVAGNNCDYANLVGDNFRPYIDGIEEAFQYLRSMDNNREDILDNLLDISVSDY